MGLKHPVWTREWAEQETGRLHGKYGKNMAWRPYVRGLVYLGGIITLTNPESSYEFFNMDNTLLAGKRTKTGTLVLTYVLNQPYVDEQEFALAVRDQAWQEKRVARAIQTRNRKQQDLNEARRVLAELEAAREAEKDSWD